MQVPRRRTVILLVDDEPRNARVLSRMLQEDGFVVELCADQTSAKGRLSQRPAPDVLLTDVRSPSADAMAVARYGRERCPKLPVLLMTSYAEQVEVLGNALGPPAMVLPKPLSYDALSAELARITKRSPRRRTAKEPRS